MAEIESNTGKYIMLAGGIILLVGFLIQYGSHFPFLSRLGNLPLDIKIEKENFKFYFPLGTSILISVLLSLIFKIIGGFK